MDKAIALVDQVRARVGMPKIEEVEKTATQEGLRDVVRHERRVELGFEGIRLFDLYRWNMLKDAVDRINAEGSKYGLWYEYRNYRGEQEKEWPIPQREIDSNSMLEQNPLWK
ncbi:MAG: RagB/SusD family nutrient uptake outer membrane protein [Bacilli bacterium]|nr:RagB/SusD family nutrient uptake outer membrane protein [Bacilli bacterium]